LKVHPLLEPVLRAAGLNRSLLPNRLLGINLGKNKLSLPDDDSDYLNGIKKLGDYADYLVINISSPNTPGLRSLQRREPVQRLLKSAIAARDLIAHKPPLLVKIAPDLSLTELEDIASVCKTVAVDGVIISNTTISRPPFIQSSFKSEGGGLSGVPLLELSLETVSKFYELTNGKITIIGCGGIRTGDDAFRFCKAGASAVQLYTSFSYDGPGVVGNICDRLEVLLNEKKWSDFVGMDHKAKTKGWLW
jgi:dihydroorotate dehydrogenase